MCGFFIILILKKLSRFKAKESMHLLNKNIKVKLSWVGAREREKKAFFVPFILSEGNFFNICVLSQCIVYWIHLLYLHTYF